MAVGEGGHVGPEFSTGFLTAKSHEVRIPIIDSETGETKELVLRTQEEIDKLVQSLRDQDPEWD